MKTKLLLLAGLTSLLVVNAHAEIPPSEVVPDSGATAGALALGLAALVLFRRRFSR